MFDKIEFDKGMFDSEVVDGDEIRIDKVYNTHLKLISIVDMHVGIIIRREDKNRKNMVKKIKQISRNELTEDIIELMLDLIIEKINRKTSRQYTIETLPHSLLPTAVNMIRLSTGNNMVSSIKAGDFSETRVDMGKIEKSIEDDLNMYKIRIFSL